MGDALRRLTLLEWPRVGDAHLYKILAANVEALFKFAASNKFEDKCNILGKKVRN